MPTYTPEERSFVYIFSYSINRTIVSINTNFKLNNIAYYIFLSIAIL